MQTPQELLKQYWGFDEFRGSQARIIDAILQQQDVLALMPTGGGKSICYQIPALAKEGICIVVSPLSKGIKAIALTGGIPFEELNNVLDNCIYGNYKFLYLSPERLQQEIVQERIQKMRVNLIAIDEAHCISQWGHDFRPAYLECALLRGLLPETPLIALTATATKQVAKDIVDHLKFIEPLEIKDSFSRKNIAFSIFQEEDKRHRLKQLCSNLKKSAIVYVRTRRLSQEIAQYLNSNNLSATFFHGGISKSEKEKKLNLWLEDKVKIIVATNAFGMGIDKPDVELVTHFQIPDSIENYFQEAGRAGRNGKPAQAVLITNKTDEGIVRKQFLSVLPDISFIKNLYRKLNNYFQIAYGEASNETYQLNFNSFCDTYKMNHLLTYNALQILDQNSVIALNESFNKKSTVQFLASKNQLFNYFENNSSLVNVTQTILRTYGGIFDFETKINTHLIAKKTGVHENKVLEILQHLHSDEIITYVAEHSDLNINFLVPREDDRTINVFAKKVTERQAIKAANLEHMLRYIKSDKICRSKQLLEYFGELVHEDCGICDVCIQNNSKEIDTSIIGNEILVLLKEKSQSSRKLITQLSYSEQRILITLQKLLEEEKIKINTKNEYEIA